MSHRSFLVSLVFLSCLIVFNSSGCGVDSDGDRVMDEALTVGRDAKSLPAADEDYLHDMDRGEHLTPDEIKGRINWIIWTGGNDRFWDYMANNSFGALDFLKTLSSHPNLGYSRDDRWKELGLVNEPCFEKAAGPDPDHYGLWLDKRESDCPPDPFANAEKYPGVEIGARGKNIPVGSYYGLPSGVVGLRLFPNPAFDEEAQENWDPDAYYTNPDYYLRNDLIRPYRVGMSCGFCHVGPSPINPPADPETPEWENLNSNPGAQYFWTDRVFFWDWKGVGAESNFFYQLFHTYMPGTLDTSFVSTDYIVNPRTMNAVYNVPARLGPAKRWGKAHLSVAELNNKQFNDYPRTQALSDFFEPATGTVYTPRVLKDGSDSVGVMGALNRVFLNIGLASEEWLRHFKPLVGGRDITPIEIAVLENNSSYWNATTDQTPDLALFFLKTAKPDYLKDAPGGDAYLTKDRNQLTRGKIVFAENCARCHSSKQPPNLCAFGEPCQQGDILENSAAYFDWMRAEVQKDDFLEDNFLSTEKRIAVTELGTNACSPLATNSIEGNIWDNFSSTTYKELPPVGKITLYNPINGEPFVYDMPGGGRGYTRPPSLISLWSSAPFLLNNSVGQFNYDPSVEGRMTSFNDSIEKMLWPEKRLRDPFVGDKIPGPSHIQRTTATSYIGVAPGYLPGPLETLFALLNKDDLRIGPIPKDTPVTLLANLNLRPGNLSLAERVRHDKKLLDLLTLMIRDLKAVKGKSDEEAAGVLLNLVPQLIDLSKCPDYIINKGHYFGSNLPDETKRALIEFLKTL